MRITINNRNNDKSRGVLVKITFPSTIQFKDHTASNIRTTVVKRTNFGVSKNSVVKGVNKRGVKTTTASSVPKIILLR